VQPLEFDFNQEPDYVEEPEKPKENADFRVGDKVIHKAFGSGIIIAIEGESGQIFFDREKSLKKILLDHPALRKL
jgi:hypothetical protein